MQASTFEVRMPTDRDVEVTRVFNAPRDLVFRAFTEPSLVKQWLLGPPGWSMPICEIDLRVDGGYRYRWRSDDDGSEFGFRGVFKEVVRPERIVHTEVYEEDPSGGEALIATRFTEQGGKTIAVMTMTYASREVRDAVLGTGTDGMAMSYDRLAELLVSMAA